MTEQRTKWQCGCRIHGGVMVQQWVPGDADIDRLVSAAKQVVAEWDKPQANHLGDAISELRKAISEQ